MRRFPRLRAPTSPAWQRCHELCCQPDPRAGSILRFPCRLRSGRQLGLFFIAKKLLLFLVCTNFCKKTFPTMAQISVRKPSPPWQRWNGLDWIPQAAWSTWLLHGGPGLFAEHRARCRWFEGVPHPPHRCTSCSSGRSLLSNTKHLRMEGTELEMQNLRMQRVQRGTDSRRGDHKPQKDKV